MRIWLIQYRVKGTEKWYTALFSCGHIRSWGDLDIAETDVDNLDDIHPSQQHRVVEFKEVA